MKQVILISGYLHKNDIHFCLTNTLLHVSQLLNNSQFNFKQSIVKIVFPGSLIFSSVLTKKT